MELAPPRVGRIANSCLGVVPAAGSVLYAVQATAVVPRLWACLGLFFSVVVAVRGYRLSIACGEAELTVRGYLRTRTIPRSSITAITGFPAVRWTDSRGRGRWSPLWVLHRGSRETRGSIASKKKNLAALCNWLQPRKRRSARR
ncbi:hypothetical protein PV396_30005 [Streptomyces sp. ME02-8801-2C]|uniref:hypothetical protein n=1 Tax=Streptomyces sp. ME02-8801-2C TaxID=3028680 RepID=UPI0029BECED4|nr:hypothetical protein [Streptomyces sp. ME02-8801-2C]MDX3456127.1 hypothetical protein [Streptomyces sp. ME02-8801-2C]